MNTNENKAKLLGSFAQKLVSFPIEGFSTGEIPIQPFNPFQLRLFLSLHKYYDQHVAVNVARTKTYGLQKQQIDMERMKQSTLQAIEENDAVFLAQKGAELMAYAISGATEYQTLAEVCVRGSLGIDKATYQSVYTYFEQYTSGLKLGQGEKISLFDKRYLSNRLEFSKLQQSLFGSSLHASGYPDFEEFSDVKFHQYLRGSKERAENVLREGQE